MNIPHTTHGQAGAVLSMEYSILLIVGGISAMGLAIMYASLLPETWYTWLSTLIDQTELAFQDYNNAFCGVASQTSGGNNGAGQVGPVTPNVNLPDIPDYMAPMSCSAGSSTATWYDGMGTPTP